MSLLKDDAETKVAFSIFENKGVYAVLLGSGVSGAAGVPTGWDITLSLIRRIARAKGVSEQPDWEKWYREETHQQPEYSSLIHELALSASERRAILDGYIEPNEEDRRRKLKAPTRAHIALAKLVRAGYIRVILTTNFDRLMENALRDEGVEPTVISSVDALRGAQPIAHSRCYLVKLHGDYKDSRILNTEGELKSYSPKINALLDRVFDEYGLIVAGWSAQWDEALRRALERAPSRRYSTFWTARGSLSDAAAELVRHRQGLAVPIKDADCFFEGIQHKIEILEATRAVEPASIDLLVNSVKAYVAKGSHKLYLADLLERQTERLRTAASKLEFVGAFDAQAFKQRLELYEGLSQPLCCALGALGRWGDDSEISRVLEILQALLDDAKEPVGGIADLIYQRSYPALLLFTSYACGLTREHRWSALHKTLTSKLDHGLVGTKPASTAELLSSGWWEGRRSNLWKTVGNRPNLHTPISDKLCDLAAIWAKSYDNLKTDFELLFERFELLVSLAVFEKYPLSDIEKLQSAPDVHARIARMPIGRFIWDSARRTALFEDLKKSDFREALFTAGFGQKSGRFLELFEANIELTRGAAGIWS
jgi:hypothetical protein